MSAWARTIILPLAKYTNMLSRRRSVGSDIHEVLDADTTSEKETTSERLFRLFLT